MLFLAALGRNALGRDEAAAAVEPTPTVAYNLTFAQLSNSSYMDWETASFSSYLYTYFVIPDEAMTWMQAPYIYVFLDSVPIEIVINSAQETVIDSSGRVVVSGAASLVMQTVWDWSNTEEAEIVIDSDLSTVVDSNGNIIIDDITSPKASREIQVYRFRDGYLVAVSKNKIRGRGKALQLRFTSEEGKEFNLLGWAGWLSKNARY